MVELAIVLLVLGIIFLLLEMWLPGMEFFAVIGVIALAISAVLAIMAGMWFVVAIQVFVIAFFLANMYRFMKRKQLQGKLILSENLDVPADQDISHLVGREGKVVSTLKPYGEVDFNGIRIEAASYGPMIAKGAKVIVSEIESRKVVVRPVEGN